MEKYGEGWGCQVDLPYETSAVLARRPEYSSVISVRIAGRYARFGTTSISLAQSGCGGRLVEELAWRIASALGQPE
jgi:hypothetical protein